MRRAVFVALILLGLGPRVILLGEKAGKGDVIPVVVEVAITVSVAYLVAMLVEKIYRRMKPKGSGSGGA